MWKKSIIITVEWLVHLFARKTFHDFSRAKFVAEHSDQADEHKLFEAARTASLQTLCTRT
jgi:hypothetical protein